MPKESKKKINKRLSTTKTKHTLSAPEHYSNRSYFLYRIIELLSKKEGYFCIGET